MILYYMTILFISSFVTKKHKKIIIYFILLTGFIEFVYAFCQKTDIFNTKAIFDGAHGYATGFTNNSNFFATLMLICLSISIGLLVENKSNSNKSKLIYLTLCAAYIIGLLFANTTSCIMGLIIVLVYLFMHFRNSKIYKQYFFIIVGIVAITTIISILGLSNQVKDLMVAFSQMFNILIGNIRPEYGTSRIYVWSKALSVLPKYWLHGIGIDNIKYLIDGKPIPYWVIYDKLHNEYLQILMTMGVFSLISYLGLYYSIVKSSIKNSVKRRELYLVLPIIGYLVQAFFNISVIEVAPLFWIILGLSIERKTDKNGNKKLKKHKKTKLAA